MTTPMYSNAHRTGRSYLTVWTPERVAEAPDPLEALVCYLQQTMGIPWPTSKQKATLRRQTREFFKNYPKASYFTLCRLAQWDRSHDVRIDSIEKFVVTHRYALRRAPQAFTELRPETRDAELEARIEEALSVEVDGYWRARLIGAAGVDARRKTLAEWMAMRMNDG